jgi:hypothetical protein
MAYMIKVIVGLEGSTVGAIMMRGLGLRDLGAGHVGRHICDGV